MKVHLNSWFETGNIYPLNWGDSENDIIKVFPEWKFRFDESKKSNQSFLLVDNIEFYFELDNFKKLNYIVISVWKFNLNYESNFFIHDWIRHDLNIIEVRQIFNRFNFSFEEAWIEKLKSLFLMPNRFTRFAFDKTNHDAFHENQTELQKIFISPDSLTDELIEERDIKISLHNTKA